MTSFRCGQNTQGGYVGFATFENATRNEQHCDCLFALVNPPPDDDDDAAFPYNYIPPADADEISFDVGIGMINGTTGGDVGYTCYAWKGTSSGTGYPTASPIVGHQPLTMLDFTNIGINKGHCLDSNREKFYL